MVFAFDGRHELFEEEVAVADLAVGRIDVKGAPLAGVLAAVFGNPINVANWSENSVFVLAKQHTPALRKQEIYFNCGRDDNYGFEKGAAALDAELTREKISHGYRPYPGDHSLTYFLAHFAEVMEFHSRAFGLLKEAKSSNGKP